MKRYSSVLIILAGVLWGSMGIFVRTLTGYGFDSLQSALLRLGSAAILMGLFLLKKDPAAFCIALKDLPWFLGIGLCSMLLMNYSYFRAISLTTMSVAAILLYTAPIMVTLMSALFFKEKLTARKLLALALAFAGCILVSGLGGEGRVTPLGIAMGLLSGLSYGLYSIFGVVLLKKYKPFTVTFYAFLVSALGSLLLADPAKTFTIIASAESLWKLLIIILLTGLITAVLPYLFYTLGLQGTEAGKASIMASAEPMVATVFGIVIYHEKLSLLSFGGILLILTAITLLNLADKKEEKV